MDCVERELISLRILLRNWGYILYSPIDAFSGEVQVYCRRVRNNKLAEHFGEYSVDGGADN